MLDRIRNANLDELIGLTLEAYGSSRNKELQNNREQFKFKTGIGRTVYANVFGFKTMDYYKDPRLCLEAQLRWKLCQFYVIKDDAPMDLLVGIDYATAFEPSLFGMEYHMEEGMEPTYAGPVIHDEEDLKKAKKPDFYKSGLMPQAHCMYQSLQELAGDRLDVFFTGFARGPWSIATMVCGFNELFIYSMEQPQFVHDLMQHIVDSRMEWETERCRYLGISPEDDSYIWKYVVYRNNANSALFEDEVDGQLFSPDFYHEFIFPYEKQLADFYGGIDYYHSCGMLTGFMEDIAKLPVAGEQHISSCTDYAKTAQTMPDGVTMQISLVPVEDVINADEQHMHRRFREIMENARGRNIDICADALYVGGMDIIDKTAQMARVFREVMETR
ncbi:hypothetical protein LJC56_00940 [Christensenellaceae bacterium OttesenSCG-928-K19]|nr:hypothetical protein [Christensenellaceae bacterium OttesenSCG-928-K19]